MTGEELEHAFARSEVIDLRTTRLLDIEGLAASAANTGRSPASLVARTERAASASPPRKSGRR